ncbi:MAG TPA: hypothetical protein VHQ86_03100 [Candidatus Saccharimonadia bacterium]|jgi:hypothetical protein|nr:hypothetical protein [Candidatus Saccharimonadia bacterium]
MAGLAIQPAQAADFPELKRLFDAANDYSLARSGTRTWNAVDMAYKDLQRAVEAGRCHVLRGPSGTIVASICLSDHSSVWGNAGRDGKALYCHKLIKDPASAPPQVGRRMLRFAAEQARANRRSLLRGDTVAVPDGLVKYYTGLGFEVRGATAYQSTGRALILLEADVDVFL